MVPDYLTIAEAERLIEKRELLPVELVDSRLDRIARLDGRLHSFIRVLADAARHEARATEAEIAAGRYRGPLHGIPIGLKDIYETAGVATTGHSKVMQDHVPQADAVAVAKLREAGAVIVGELATHEFGLAGIKPTYGLISRIGILPLAFSLDHAGPLAWTAEDSAIMLQAMAGHDPADPASPDHPVPDYRAALQRDASGLRLGLVRHFYERDNEANAATCDAITAAMRTLEGLCCSVREVTLSPLADWVACGVVIMLCEAYTIHEVNLRRRFTDYGEMFRDRMALAGLITGADYVQALRRRRELIDELDRAMEDLDLLLTAAAPTEAPPIDAVGKFATFERPLLTMPFNVTGSPAMSVCCGYTDSGLPLSFQIVGKRFDDATVLRLAHAYEQATPWRDRRPTL